MRISDWSSDVCSSDLFLRRRLDRTETGDLDERLDSGQRRQATHGGNPRSSGGNATIDDQPRRRNALNCNSCNRDRSFRSCTKLRCAAHRAGLSGILRSEEHTSELQSLMRITYAVFCFKKKTIVLQNHYTRPPHNLN